MSQIPRRTSEFQSSAIKTSASLRQSRLAQPSSALRSGLSRASSSNTLMTGLSRASSSNTLMTGMTPSRTPNRSQSRDRATIFPMTAEKEKAPVEDRMFVAEKTHQILEALGDHSEFKELSQKGLKAMTHKQFIMILQLFLKPIVGTNVNIDGSNYVDYVYNLITSPGFDYPYTMNKSSLKTPSAPHCQNSIIILLAWLTEFVVFEADQSMIDYSATEEFNSAEFTKNFMGKMGEAFIYWNNQDESETAKIQEMRKMYLEKMLGHGGNIETELDRLKTSIEQLQRESQPVSLMQEINEKFNTMKGLKKECKNLERINNDLSLKISNLEDIIKSKQASKENASKELFKWREKLSRQAMTQEQRNKLLVEITEVKGLLEIKRNDVMELTERSSEREIQLSNLIRKKSHLIDKLNNLIYTLASELQVSGMHEKFDPATFEIKTTNIGDAVLLEAEIDRLRRGLIQLSEKFQHALAIIAKSLIELDVEENKLNNENTLLVEEIQTVKTSFDKVYSEKIRVEAKIDDLIRKSESKYRENAARLDNLNSYTAKLKTNIATYHRYIEQVVADKDSFKKKSLAECKALYEKRKHEVEDKRRKINEMKVFLTEFANAQKPMPENVQKIVNDVLKKRDMNKNSSNHV